MTIDRELLSQHIDDISSVRESIRLEFVRGNNPGLPAAFEKLQTAVSALEDCENLLDGLVKG